MRPLLSVALVSAALAAGSGFAVAQTPAPARPAALSDNLPVPDAPAPKVSKAWLLMDYATGQVLAGENVDAQVEPASITKVMTSYVIAAEMAAGKVKANDPVLMSEHLFPAHRTEFVVELPFAEPSTTPAGLRLVE